MPEVQKAANRLGLGLVIGLAPVPLLILLFLATTRAQTPLPSTTPLKPDHFDEMLERASQYDALKLGQNYLIKHMMAVRAEYDALRSIDADLGTDEASTFRHEAVGHLGRIAAAMDAKWASVEDQ